MTEDLFSEAEEKRSRLLEMFEELPVVIIHGVVGAGGLSACRIPPETKWTVSLDLIAWREEGGEVHNDAMTVTTIFPFCRLDSICRWASAILCRVKVLSITGFNAPGAAALFYPKPLWRVVNRWAAGGIGMTLTVFPCYRRLKFLYQHHYC